MNGYILIALQLLLSALIIWRMRQNLGSNVGCMPGGLIVMVVVALITLLYFLIQALFGDSGTLLDEEGLPPTATPSGWATLAIFGLFMAGLAATTCSLIGFAITGHHPKFCKMVWKTLAGVLFLPTLSLGFLSLALVCAFSVCMGLMTLLSAHTDWGTIILMAFFSFMCMIGFLGLLILMLDINDGRIEEYTVDSDERSFRRIDGHKKGGGQ